MKIILDYLVLEITRKCNMRCPHCLRGAAQPVEMDLNIINFVTEATDHISRVVFTGGEPSLNADAINHFRWASHFNNCGFNSFWLTVNAKFFKKDFYDAIWNLYRSCDNPTECVMTISGDQYHSKRSNKALDMYCLLPFFTNERMENIRDGALLDEGMARKNQIGRFEVIVPRYFSESEYIAGKDTLYIRDTVYINAKGDVLLCCDLSYAHQKKHIIGNVLRKPLADILMRKIKIKDQVSA